MDLHKAFVLRRMWLAIDVLLYTISTREEANSLSASHIVRPLKLLLRVLRPSHFMSPFQTVNWSNVHIVSIAI